MKQFRRPRSDCNFDELLSEVDWSAVIGSLDEDRNDVTSAYQSFITKFQQIYNYCFPISLQNSRSRTPRKEWMTAGLLTACRIKNILYRKFIKNPTNSNRQTLTFTLFFELLNDSFLLWYSALIFFSLEQAAHQREYFTSGCPFFLQNLWLSV